MIRFLQYQIKRKTGECFSAEAIRDELCRIQDSILKNTVDDNKYVVPSKPSNDAIKIYQAVGKKREVVPFRLTAGV
jgi:exonuclease V gamma subunit